MFIELDWEQLGLREDVRGSFLSFASKSGVLLAAGEKNRGQTTVVTDCCTRCQTFTVGNLHLKSHRVKQNFSEFLSREFLCVFKSCFHPTKDSFVWFCCFVFKDNDKDRTIHEGAEVTFSW